MKKMKCKTKIIQPLALMLLIIFGGNLQAERDQLLKEYGIIDYSDEADAAKSSIKFFLNEFQSSENPVELFYKIKVAYNNVVPVQILNESDQPAKIKVMFESAPEMPVGAVGPGGDDFIEIPANSTMNFPFKIFSQDVTPGLYPLSAAIKNETGEVVDSIKGKIFVSAPMLRLSVQHKKTAGLMQVFEITNSGDTLSNFSIELEGLDNYRIQPRVEHYLFGAGKSLEVAVLATGPVSGSEQGKFIFRASGQTVKAPVEFELPEGMRTQIASLDPVVHLNRKDWYCTNRPIINLRYDVPYIQKVPVNDEGFTAKFSWLQKDGAPFDTDGNGRPDHWELVKDGQVTMAGDDYDDDGSIDFFRYVDIEKRTLNRSYVKIDGRWSETNLVDAYLVSSFLPMTDVAKVKPHDVEILLNGKSIHTEKNLVPAGSYLFRLPINLLNENMGSASKNTITISTKHLPGQHYQVTAENKLLLHYSVIQLPVLTKEDIKLSTVELDRTIRTREEELASESNQAKKIFFENQLNKLKAERDRQLRENEEYFKKYLGKSNLELQGVKYTGVDLALYSSDLKLNNNKLHGIVRNLGYLSASYQVRVYEWKPGAKAKRVVSKNFPALPPFARRNFTLVLPGDSRNRRVLYRVRISALKPKDKELVISNNTAHLVVGEPPSGHKELRLEMGFLADEMGRKEDSVTLTRELALPTIRPGRYYSSDIHNNSIRQLEFSAPLKQIDKSSRVFILE